MKRLALGLILSLWASTAFAQLPPSSGLSVGTTPVQGGTTGQCLYKNGNVLGAQACGGGTAADIKVGTTTVSSGTTGRVLYDNGGTLGEMTTSGTGTQLALTASPSFTGTPLFAQGTVAARSLSLGNDAGTYGSGINANSSNELMWVVGGSAVFFTTFAVTRYARDHVWGWTSSQYNPESTANDVAFSRLGAASLALGNGSASNTSGTLSLATLNATSAVMAGASSGTTTLQAAAAASGTLTLPAATDTLVGKATTDVLTNKTYDTAGTGNVLKIDGTQVSAVQGSGSVSLGLGDAWTAFSPTIAPGAGSFTSASATGRYKQVGKTYLAEFTVTITTNGTASSYYTLTLPNSAAAQGGFGCSGADNATAKALSASGRDNSNLIYIWFYDGTYSGATGATQWVSCTFEAR